MNLVNLTPHVITLLPEGGEAIAVQPEAKPCRCVETHVPETSSIAGLPFKRIAYGAIENLPEQKPNTIYIVSAIVAARAKIDFPQRKDIMIVGDTVRNAEGQIIGAKALCYY